jgi:hypothetical protein
MGAKGAPKAGVHAFQVSLLGGGSGRFGLPSIAFSAFPDLSSAPGSRGLPCPAPEPASISLRYQPSSNQALYHLSCTCFPRPLHPLRPHSLHTLSILNPFHPAGPLLPVLLLQPVWPQRNYLAR